MCSFSCKVLFSKRLSRNKSKNEIFYFIAYRKKALNLNVITYCDIAVTGPNRD